MNTTETQSGSSIQRVVRRFVVQERYAKKTERDWYDDPHIHESLTLEDARKRLQKDLSESLGHGDAYLHRIIERTERVLRGANEKGQR